jgi:hypothetical protein
VSVSVELVENILHGAWCKHCPDSQAKATRGCGKKEFNVELKEFVFK